MLISLRNYFSMSTAVCLCVPVCVCVCLCVSLQDQPNVIYQQSFPSSEILSYFLFVNSYLSTSGGQLYWSVLLCLKRYFHCPSLFPKKPTNKIDLFLFKQKALFIIHNPLRTFTIFEPILHLKQFANLNSSLGYCIYLR